MSKQISAEIVEQRLLDRLEAALDVCLCDQHIAYVREQLDRYVAMTNLEPFEHTTVDDGGYLRPARTYLEDDLPWVAPTPTESEPS